jgi:hypothetical protein
LLGTDVAAEALSRAVEGDAALVVLLVPGEDPGIAESDGAVGTVAARDGSDVSMEVEVRAGAA